MGQINSSESSDSIAGYKLEKKQEVAIDYDSISPRFSVYNIEELQGGIEHLNEYGYAVFSNVLNNEEVDHSVNLFWNYLENLEEPYHIQRNNSQTWDKPWPGAPHIGLVNRYGIGQSEFMWFIRGNPNVKKVFSHIWNSDELCVSFDGAGCFRNWHLNKEWKTSGGWYHCDQNPFKKPNRCSIQGLVALTDNNESTGSLVVVPESHKYFLELPSAAQERRIWGDYISVPQQHSIFKKLRPRLVKCKAGDLVVWDSRCVHCNTPAIVDNENNDQLELLRIVAYICMSPISMFVPDMDEYKSLEEFRQLREHCVQNRSTCTHWPLQLVGAGHTVLDNKISLKLNAYQHSLIIGTHVEHENGTAEIEF
ncbi:unnamed protein product [Rotaria magnacalcarata]|uniref:Phytanoyl-CoA dioxygenase n=1 Tax=Rotaria magnacalcarata TaxID=392030 RepID=A0A816XPR9_9BILA|nr:unnamed protein product [Rotaria magnacalcarata]CAF1572747.1 unnamed protein product [Rotaria magnacalcarata]CAF2147863.1 unnamed protein product [Rotaria magnacalcarata]CAF2228974.1 unnamed protein product [Rotaria magnacalcarata]CAF2261070.1 unnamed protein product [Rotaria magnacalcarata]